MDKTNINALVQSVECSLHLICNRARQNTANYKAELKKRVPWENDKRNRKNNTEKKMLCELIIELGYKYTKIYFQLNSTNSPQKLAWICLKNRALLCHCVVVDSWGYTFTLDGQKSWWGATGSGGRTVKCAANEDETWLWPWQYYLSNVFLGSCWSKEYCVGFSVTFWHGRGKNGSR